MGAECPGCLNPTVLAQLFMSFAMLEVGRASKERVAKCWEESCKIHMEKGRDKSMCFILPVKSLC